jgi:hypothetical protein
LFIPASGFQTKQSSTDLSESPDVPAKGYVKSTVGFFEKQDSQDVTTPQKEANVRHFSRPTLSSILKSRERSHSPILTLNSMDRKSSKKVSSNACLSKPSQGPRDPTTPKARGGEYSEFLLSTMVPGNLGVSFNDVIGHKKSKRNNKILSSKSHFKGNTNRGIFLFRSLARNGHSSYFET